MIINIHLAGSPRIRPSEIHDNMISKGNMLAFAGLKEVSEETKPPIDQKEMTEPPQITTEKPKNGRSKGQRSIMEPFCENSYQFLAVNFFRKNALSEVFERLYIRLWLIMSATFTFLSMLYTVKIR